MKTKLDIIVKECQKSAPKQDCKHCQCEEKDCMSSLMDTFAVMVSRGEI